MSYSLNSLMGFYKGFNRGLGILGVETTAHMGVPVGIHRDKDGESKLWGWVTSDSMGVWRADIGVEITRETTIWGLSF